MHPEKSRFILDHAGIKIYKSPLSRPGYLKELLKREGLGGTIENIHAAYCALPLTQAPEELKPEIRKRQKILAGILSEAGINSYDPGSAPYSPDLGLTIKPDEIYRVDTGKLLGARFFTFLDFLPTTGGGMEEKTSLDCNRIAVVLHDKNILTSRMQPNRTIHLQYDNLEKQREDFIEVFKFLQYFKPGMGFDNGEPALLGFLGNKVYNLEKLIYQIFPDLKYEYDPKVPSIKLKAVNPELLS